MSEDFSAWIGRVAEHRDVLEPARSAALSAALGRPREVRAGDALPLLHHWLYFWDVQPPAALGLDGHPARGGFLPPVALPRRMWAGGRVAFLKPLAAGDTATRVSTIKDVSHKTGRSGALVFVTVVHEIATPAGLCVREEQDIVYRDAPRPSAPPPLAPPPSGGFAADLPACAWRKEVAADPVLLFRYSALTMNGHRIHYDHPYATGVEGYRGLVVHAPLQATLLIGLAERELDGCIAGFEFRGVSPAFDTAPLGVCGAPTPIGASLWTEQGGRQAMTATVALS